jgi:flagellar biosynthesis component FlhA
VKPSGQPRLVPNGGSSLKPALFILAVPTVFAMVLCPPVGLVLALIGGLILFAKWDKRRERRRAASQHELEMQAYHQRRAAREACERWTNPGWRV